MSLLRRPDIGFVPTPADAATAMLTLAQLSPADCVYDLGCGDGRREVSDTSKRSAKR